MRFAWMTQCMVSSSVLSLISSLPHSVPVTLTESLILMGAAAAAGTVNAVAGGGTLITFPSLLLVGTSSVVANATSTLALVIGTAAGIYGYRKQVLAVRPWLKKFVPVSLAGGLIGSILLTRTNEKVFAHLVPFLLLFATVVFIFQGTFKRVAGFPAGSGSTVSPHHSAMPLAVVFQFLVAVYGGYFGAGIGILMLASLGFIGLTDIHEMNSLKNILGSLINTVAAAYFVYSGLVDWSKAGVMTAGALAGYYFGSHYSQKISQAQVRRLITGVGLTISLIFFYRQFIH